MSRSNYDKPFYVDVGTSIVAIRCASNHDVVAEYDHARSKGTVKLAKDICDRMNQEAEIGRPRRNCDVGTVLEQAKRFAEFCRQHKHPESECLDCPLLFQAEGHCELAWEQMPCEDKEGGAK